MTTEVLQQTVPSKMLDKSSMFLESLWRCSFVGEIVSLQGFSEDNLFVDFTVDCPSGWLFKDEQVTGLSWKSRPNKFDVCHLCLPIDIDLFHEWSETSSGDLEWPTLIVTVKSIDRLERHSISGIGSVILPRSPGQHVISMPTVKKVPVSSLERMSQFFLGFQEEEEPTKNCRRFCRRKSEDDSLQIDEDAEDPADSEPEKPCYPSHLASFPETTESSGVVNLSLFCMIRAESSIERQRRRRTDLLLSIKQVIQAFETAKERMMEITKKIKENDNDVDVRTTEPIESDSSSTIDGSSSSDASDEF